MKMILLADTANFKYLSSLFKSVWASAAQLIHEKRDRIFYCFHIFYSTFYFLLPLWHFNYYFTMAVVYSLRSHIWATGMWALSSNILVWKLLIHIYISKVSHPWSKDHFMTETHFFSSCAYLYMKKIRTWQADV